MRLPNDIDIHSHSGAVSKDRIVCVDPTETKCLPEGDGYLSVGIHPWNADKADDDAWERMAEWLADPRVIAVGEAGYDKLRGPSPEIQDEVFGRQVEMCSQTGLPLIIHCVRAIDKLLDKRKNNSGQWILHGFRGKPEQARQLLDKGIDLSYGSKYNPASFSLTPPERLYRETDN